MPLLPVRAHNRGNKVGLRARIMREGVMSLTSRRMALRGKRLAKRYTDLLMFMLSHVQASYVRVCVCGGLRNYKSLTMRSCRLCQCKTFANDD